jgi:hypothetical protein
MSVSVGHRLDAQIKCSAPEVKDFSSEQLAALHLFKHEVLSAAYRLYMHVPQEVADPILSKFFRLKLEELGDVKV